MKAIQTQGVITSLTSKTDRSLGVRFSTPELSSQEKALFFELQGINLTLVFTPMDEEPTQVAKINADIQSKTQSQRLRAILFLLWRQAGEIGKFETYYHVQMEKIIIYLKGKLE